MNILVVDVGGTSVKVLANRETVPRAFDSGPTLTPSLLRVIRTRIEHHEYAEL